VLTVKSPAPSAASLGYNTATSPENVELATAFFDNSESTNCPISVCAIENTCGDGSYITGNLAIDGSW